jgi:2-C-methyl-D-erythritol 2,4-cyclodiphosphate synthase
MQQNLARLLEIDSDKVSVKATTYELMGPVGQSEGIQVESIVLLKKINL